MGTTLMSMALAIQVLQSGVIETITERAQAHGVSAAQLVAIAACETGGTFNPNAVGDRGQSIGIFQIHDRGLYQTFLDWGYSDRTNVWEAADFAARAIARGLRSHWHC